MSEEPKVKLEKITLWTSIDSYGQEGSALQVLTALDEIIPILEDAGIQTKILSYDTEDLEMQQKTNQLHEPVNTGLTILNEPVKDTVTKMTEQIDSMTERMSQVHDKIKQLQQKTKTNQ